MQAPTSYGLRNLIFPLFGMSMMKYVSDIQRYSVLLIPLFFCRTLRLCL